MSNVRTLCVFTAWYLPYDWPFPFLFSPFPCFPPAGAPAGGGGGALSIRGSVRSGALEWCACTVRWERWPAGLSASVKSHIIHSGHTVKIFSRTHVRAGQFWSAIPPLSSHPPCEGRQVL